MKAIVTAAALNVRHDGHGELQVSLADRSALLTAIDIWKLEKKNEELNFNGRTFAILSRNIEWMSERT